MRVLSGLLALLLGGSFQISADILYSVTDLGTLGGNFSEGHGINNAGQVVGTSRLAPTLEHAFLYSNGQLRDLNDLVDPRMGITLFGATAINDNGQILASRYLLSSNGQITDLGTLGGDRTSGSGLNNAGQVTGYSRTSGNGPFHAFLYRSGQMIDLGTLGGRDSGGLSINEAGQVVGYSDTFTGLPAAFLYRNGQLRDLNSLIDLRLGINLTEATAINDSGQIVANGIGETGGRAYLLTPVPEPSTLALFGVAMLGLGAWARRHPNMFR